MIAIIRSYDIERYYEAVEPSSLVDYGRASSRLSAQARFRVKVELEIDEGSVGEFQRGCCVEIRSTEAAAREKRAHEIEIEKLTRLLTEEPGWSGCPTCSCAPCTCDDQMF